MAFTNSQETRDAGKTHDSIACPDEVKEENTLRKHRLCWRDSKDTRKPPVQKTELKRLEAKLLETKIFMEEVKARKEKVNKAPLTFKEFVAVMEDLPAKIKRVQSTTEKHALIAPMFLNFSVSAKKVEKSTLKQPFEGLFNEKLSEGGDGEI